MEKHEEERNTAAGPTTRAVRIATHTSGARGNKKPHGSTSGLPRPANIVELSYHIGHAKSTASERVAVILTGPIEMSASYMDEGKKRRTASYIRVIISDSTYT